MARKQKQKKTSIWRSVLLGVISLVIGLSLYGWNARSLVGNTLPMPFGYGAAVVLSGSMEPTLSVDDLIFVRQVRSCEVGDVVVFQDGNQMVVHRVIAANGADLQTQGDANNMADRPITMADVKGKVVLTIPAVGAVVRALKTPVGTICCIVLLLVLLELPHYRERKKDDEELEQIKAEIRRLKEEQRGTNA